MLVCTSLFPWPRTAVDSKHYKLIGEPFVLTGCPKMSLIFLSVSFFHTRMVIPHIYEKLVNVYSICIEDNWDCTKASIVNEFCQYVASIVFHFISYDACMDYFEIPKEVLRINKTHDIWWSVYYIRVSCWFE